MSDTKDMQPPVDNKPDGRTIEIIKEGDTTIVIDGDTQIVYSPEDKAELAEGTQKTNLAELYIKLLERGVDPKKFDMVRGFTQDAVETARYYLTQIERDFDLQFLQAVNRLFSGMVKETIRPAYQMMRELAEEYKRNKVIFDELKSYSESLEYDTITLDDLDLIPVSIYFDLANEFLAAQQLEECPEKLTEEQKALIHKMWDDFVDDTAKKIKAERRKRARQAAKEKKKAEAAAAQTSESEALEVPTLTQTDIVAMVQTPSTALTNLVQQVLNYGASGGANALRASHGTQIQYITSEKDDSLEIQSRNSRSEISITIEDAAQFLNSRHKSTRKIFTFLLQQANAQHFGETIIFPLQALVDVGMYTNIPNARAGFKTAMERITRLHFSGTVREGRKKVYEAGGVLFYHYAIDQNTCFVSLNQNINTDLVSQYITHIPTRAFALNNRAFSCIEYIFYLARQNAGKIKESRSFNISLQSLANHLCLPSPTETRKHSAQIIEPIESAITEIEEVFKGEGFTITPIYKEGNVYDFLAGYIRIELPDEYAKGFIGIADKTEQKKALHQKRQESIEKAVAIKKAEATAAKAEKGTT